MSANVVIITFIALFCVLNVSAKPAADEKPKKDKTQVEHPCFPTPCGLNSICTVSSNSSDPVCSCLPDHIGSPPNCRQKCIISQNCLNSSLVCVNKQCVDPCNPSPCGFNSLCTPIKHNPICSCLSGYTGDPFEICSSIDEVSGVGESKKDKIPIEHPCLPPSPCGPNSICTSDANNPNPVCSCLPDHIGSPPNCIQKCIVTSNCKNSSLVCINQQCVDPCPNLCGANAHCTTSNHSPKCSCISGYTGDPYNGCSRNQNLTGEEKSEHEKPQPDDPCKPSPCGPNSKCRIVADSYPSCSCLPGHVGSPPNCRQKCALSQECSDSLACINDQCIDPCNQSPCGVNSVCTPMNHNPICSCPSGYKGDPFETCSRINNGVVDKKIKKDKKTEISNPYPCNPSPCGLNSQCTPLINRAACSYLEDYNTQPASCTWNSNCTSPLLTCINKKCLDPCPGTCGIRAVCHMANHLPSCYCLPGYTGDPFIKCNEML